MADVSDPAIASAYEQVRDDKTDVNWLLIDYEGPRSDKLTLTATGNAGLAELKEHLSDDNASFAYVRVSYANDKESQREKFILVVWIGSGVKVMRKAKISVHSADVKTVLRTFSIEVAAKDKDDLEEEPIVVRLRKEGRVMTGFECIKQKETEMLAEVLITGGIWELVFPGNITPFMPSSR